MSITEINYPKFIDYVHSNFESSISREEVEEILHLEEDYNKDSPISLGKSLVLDRLIFSGKKVMGTEFRYDQAFYSGINLWIADNHKGKSTIFKIIKFALTGNDSIKPDIKPWINEIMLEFHIGNATYTCYIDKTGRDKGAMYSFGIEKLLELQKNHKLDTIEKEKEFEFKSKSQFEEKIQEFFFEHFSFYTLKYTQKKGGKEELGLNTANLSWSTYFKSIYLESNNYEYLFFNDEKFGSQGRKIFEMILGLRLTYPINMLGIQRDSVLEDIGKLKLIDNSKNETKKSKYSQLQKRHLEILKILETLNKDNQINFDEKPLIEEYNRLQEKINENRKTSRIAKSAYQFEKDTADSLEEEIRNLQHDLHKMNDEVNKLTKQELNVVLYKETESFFSNLEIKVCPHCEVEVSNDKKEAERKTHKCSLCGETSVTQRIEEEELQEKINYIKGEKDDYSNKINERQKHINTQKLKLDELRISITNQYSKMIELPSIEKDIARLKEIENEIETINKEREKHQKSIEEKNELTIEEAVVNFQLQEIEREKSSDNSENIIKLSLKRDILNYALQSLERKRIELNKDTLNKLEQLTLNEIHAFGLSNINKIEINDKYDLIFTQNEVAENFSDLSEGEKLRVKLAFYLSLIQLDIEYNLGRHPRFLIFDSPGSEEMIQEHLQGLSDIFKSVNERFKDKLQIFVGSALREFIQITEPEKATIKSKDDFVF